MLANKSKIVGFGVITETQGLEAGKISIILAIRNLCIKAKNTNVRLKWILDETTSIKTSPC